MTKRCPLTYDIIANTETYSKTGLQQLSSKLSTLRALPLSAEALRKEARLRSTKMSIQGVQPKLSAVLSLANQAFELVDYHGKYILKPPSDTYPELPENEDLTMHLASLVGIEVPLHGLIYNQDKTLTYFIKRFDRSGHIDRLLVEDFSQLSGHTRDTKYDFSMEKIVDVIEQFCTFPLIEKRELLLRTLFHYLTGNEDMHLKNFSLIRRDNKITLAPAYDFLNTTLAIGNAKDEIALPLHGKRSQLTRKDLIDYFAKERLQLNDAVMNDVIRTLREAVPLMLAKIDTSFLSDEAKAQYSALLQTRVQRML